MLDSVQPIQPLDESPDDGDAAARPACANLQGIVRRGVAFALDMVPFTVVAGLVALLFPRAVIEAYPWSRLAALPLVVLFRAGFQATAGRTPGQRLLGLRVAQRDGRPPSFGQAVARNTVAVLPMVLNHFAPPGLPLGSVVWGVLATVAVFGVGLGSTYLLAFNRGTRQALHDVVAGTFVWYGPGQLSSAPATPLPRKHEVVLSLLAVVFAGGPAVAAHYFAPGAPLPALVELRREVHALGRFQDVGVSQVTQHGSRGEERVLYVVLEGRFDQALLEAQAHDIASLVRARSAELAVDRLVVQRVESYDLFFVSSWQTELTTVQLSTAPAPAPAGGP